MVSITRDRNRATALPAIRLTIARERYWANRHLHWDDAEWWQNFRDWLGRVINDFRARGAGDYSFTIAQLGRYAAAAENRLEFISRLRHLEEDLDEIQQLRQLHSAPASQNASRTP